MHMGASRQQTVGDVNVTVKPADVSVAIAAMICGVMAPAVLVVGAAAGARLDGAVNALGALLLSAGR